MKAFMYGIGLQWKLDMRNKEALIMYYLVPLVFFLFVGQIFLAINPLMKETLIQSMTIFAAAMGTSLGTPAPLTSLYGSDIKKAYHAGNIPLWTPLVNNAISAFMHLMITSTIIYILAPVVHGASRPERAAEYFGALALFLLVSISLGSVIGLLIKSPSKMALAGQVIFLPSILLSGIMMPGDLINLLPKTFQYAGRLFPATWAFEIMQNGGLELQKCLPLLLILAIASIVIGCLLLRVQKD